MRTLLLLAIMATLAGCSSYNGILPNKDVHMKNVTLTIMSPWGQQVLHADELDTRLDKAKSNRPFPVLEKSNTVTTNTTSTSTITAQPTP